jgi:uncharacterized repeat protein (TIGR03803 family)
MESYMVLHYTGGIKNAGVIFSFDPSSSTYKKLKDFDTDDANPQGSLLQASDGKLYGMTLNGGSSGNGVVFSFDPSSTTYKKLKNLDYYSGNPFHSLIQAGDGKLYGMIAYGGSSGIGVIFSFNISSSTFSTVKDFEYPEGSTPKGLMQASDGKLYGMTLNGGSSGTGVVFSFDPSSATFKKLKDLSSTNGSNPYGSLIQASDGKLYGMAAYGGSKNIGVIFSYDFSTSSYIKLKDFENTGGASPHGSLVQASNGKLYGMTTSGGSSNYGVIFSFDPPLLIILS